MTQTALSFEAPTKRSRLDAMAGYFMAHENEWISAMTLMAVGGECAWRTRISDCRKELLMRIENKLELQADGTKRSWYRYQRTAA